MGTCLGSIRLPGVASCPYSCPCPCPTPMHPHHSREMVQRQQLHQLMRVQKLIQVDVHPACACAVVQQRVLALGSGGDGEEAHVQDDVAQSAFDGDGWGG